MTNLGFFKYYPLHAGLARWGGHAACELEESAVATREPALIWVHR
jgi:hypothetical protein